MYISQYARFARDGDWTDAFCAAISDLRLSGGGELRVGAGLYMTKPIKLVSRMTLYLEAGAELRFSDEPSEFPVLDLEFEGILSKAYAPCVYAEDAESVTLAGEGTLNGQGESWWRRHKNKELSFARPYLVCFNRCKHVNISGLTLINSPVWTVHPLRCEDVHISRLRIINPPDSPNTDGIDPDACSDVTIRNCYIDVGDDCIAIKSGTEDTPDRRACERVVISGCHFLHGHGGVVLGSEMSGGIRDVLVSDCVFFETDRGIRLKTRRGRGGEVRALRANNLIMNRVMCPFVFNMYYFCGKNGKTPYVSDKSALPVDARTPRLGDVSITNVSISGATACAGFFCGLPEAPVESVSISGVNVGFSDAAPATPAMMADCPPMKNRGFYLRNAVNVRIENVRYDGLEGPEIDDGTQTE